MKIELFDHIPSDAKMIRTKVFIEEQGFADEYDDMDHTAGHLVAYEDGKPVAACSFFQDREKNAYVLGRLAVLPEYRGKKIGALLIKEVEARAGEYGGKMVCLHAQCRACEFYEKQGYQKTGAVEPEQGCPHIWMYKKI